MVLGAMLTAVTPPQKSERRKYSTGGPSSTDADKPKEDLALTQRTSYLSKETVNKVRRQGTNWEKVFIT